MKFYHEKFREADGKMHPSLIGELFTCGPTKANLGQKLVAVLGMKGKMIWIHKDFQK